MLYQHDTWQALSISVYGDWRQQHMKENWVYRRGDLYLANLGVPVGSKQGGVRPVVVLQNDVGNYYAPTITIAPLTSKIEKKRKQPTHFFLRKAKGLAKPSMVLAEQLDTCDKISVTSADGSLPTPSIPRNSAPSAAIPLTMGILWDEAPNDLDLSGGDTRGNYPFRAL